MTRPIEGLSLGHIWYVPAAQRTSANTEATYLLLKHSFEEYQARRVEWKCDSLNERSRAAALRLGFSIRGHLPQSHDRQRAQPRHGLVCHDR